MRWIDAIGRVGLAGGLGIAAHAHAQPTYAELAPILQARCVMCHSGASAAAGLKLDTFEGLLAGSARGPVVRAGAGEASELVRRLRGTSAPRMPMTGPPFLSDAQIAQFAAWIDAGMPAGAPSAAVEVKPAWPAPGEPVTYAHVAPIFARRCASCHTERGRMGPAPEGYRLNSYAATIATVDRARVVPGRPEASELMRRVRGQARPRMPFDGPPYLDDADIALIERWIADGARDGQGQAAPIPVGAAVRLHGTLTGPAQLDSLPLRGLAGAGIDRARVGGYAEVRGRVTSEGEIEVQRLRGR
ncbi:MAG: c-type cytochrome domain-containing protein [Burkholderiaceae bacterium]